MVCIHEIRNIKFNYKNSFKDHLQYSKSSFFQQYQLIIFLAFIILCTGLIILTSLILIFFIIETRRKKRYPSRYSQSDSKFSSQEDLLLNHIIIIIIIINILDYSDVFTFKRMNNKQEKFAYNNINGNIMKHNLNDNEIESVS